MIRPTKYNRVRHQTSGNVFLKYNYSFYGKSYSGFGNMSSSFSNKIACFSGTFHLARCGSFSGSMVTRASFSGK